MFWSVLALRSEANDILAHNYIVGRSRLTEGLPQEFLRHV